MNQGLPNVLSSYNSPNVTIKDTNKKHKSQAFFILHLSSLSKNSVKTLSISFKYDILQGENVKFVLGALHQKERLIEIPLSKDKSEINLKINLKNKTITGDVQRVITENIRSIMWVGLLLEDSAVKID